MNILHLSSNAKAYIFYDLKPIPTAVYRIEGDKHQFLIDTYCGRGYLTEVCKDIKACSKPLIVINTHHHWDHIWGNCIFSNAPIAAHTLCRQAMKDHWEQQLLENQQYVKGQIDQALPTITFDHHMTFEEDGIELFHSPGHTLDSISIYDRNHKILYGGDNLELPFVYINHKDLDQYIQVLTKYLDMDVAKYTGSHTITVTKEDIHHMIQYLTDLKNGKTYEIEDSYHRFVHELNLSILKES